MLPRDGEFYPLCNICCMVADAFQIFCNHQKVNAEFAIFPIFENQPNQFLLHLIKQTIHHIIILHNRTRQCQVLFHKGFHCIRYHLYRRTRHFLKVQDGCDYFCTYCTIPYARGFSRNPSIESLVDQARQTAREGGKEIVIKGVNIGDFGKTTHERFIDLVKALDQVEEIKRYRISSLEPDLLSDELIDYCAHSRAFMPHFHIPLQSGSDRVLKLMHRRYDSKLFAHKINLIKEKMPDAFIGVDVMVGCRGEHPEDFEDCYNFLDSLPVTQLHVFPYSERPGTSALSIPYIVDEKEKKNRSKRLLQLSERKTHDFYSAHIGKEAEVLFERTAANKPMHGFTRNYIRVELPASNAKEEYDNEIIRVRLGGFNLWQDALKAEVIS